jgi:predicted DNA binding CopG/RHH family protein
MSKTIKYTDGEIGKVKIIDDFLPRPKDLIFKNDSVKVTISLSKNSVAFFKDQAQTNHVSYQKVIKALLDQYADNYQYRKKA